MINQNYNNNYISDNNSHNPPPIIPYDHIPSSHQNSSIITITTNSSNKIETIKKILTHMNSHNNDNDNFYNFRIKMCNSEPHLINIDTKTVSIFTLLHNSHFCVN